MTPGTEDVANVCGVTPSLKWYRCSLGRGVSTPRVSRSFSRDRTTSLRHLLPRAGSTQRWHAGVVRQVARRTQSERRP
jgi:hypothetical protein